MIIEPFRTDDIPRFIALAATENWVAEPWEYEFLLAAFPAGCFTARGKSGEAAGFVTSLRHGRSGWIGNLIVAECSRGRGIGEALFRKAMAALAAAGVATIWLTASKSGTPLYEKHGFTSVDTIIRWVGRGRQRHPGHARTTGGVAMTGSSYDIDRVVWGDRRGALLDVTTQRGALLQSESGFIVRQPCGEVVQFGPFAALDAGAAEELFREAAAAVPSGTKLLLDAPASNRAAQRIYRRCGMVEAGSYLLMYAGRKPEYRPDLLYALATMGSCG